MLCHCPMCQEVSLTLSMVLLGRKTNFKQADCSSIYIVNHQDAHTMYDVTVYEWQQSLGTCLGTWVLGYLSTQGTCLDTWVTGYLVPKYLWYLFEHFIRKHKKSVQHVV